jgi:hypothetical protein
MRVVELSDHPSALLRQERKGRTSTGQREQAQYEEALAHHRQRVGQARQARDQARADHRWWAWLRGMVAVRRERRRAPAPPRRSQLPSDREEILEAGIEGERSAVAEFGRALDAQWTLLRGYRNRGGEIDHLLLGPGGLVAIEGKHRNATVHCDRDQWWFTKYDRYGNPVGQGELTDRRGRSPSEQLNQPADILEDFLRSRGHPVAIRRVVLFTHPRSRLGNCTNPTVHITTSAGQVIKLINTAPEAIDATERAALERLITRDHSYHQNRRPPR